MPPQFWRELRPWRRSLLWVGACLLLQMLCSLLLLVFAHELEPFFQDPQMALFFSLLCGIVGVYLVRFGAEYAQLMICEQISAQWAIQRRERAFAHLLRSGSEGSTEHWLTVLGDDLERAREALLTSLHRLIPSLIMLSFLFAALLYLSWILTLALLLWLPLFAGLSQWLGGRLRRAARSRQHSLSQILEELGEGLRQLLLLRLYHRQEDQQLRLERAQLEWFQHHLQTLRWQHLERPLMGSLQIISLSGILIFALYLIQHNALNLSDLLAYGAAVGLAVDPGLWVGESWAKVQASEASWERLQRLESLPPQEMRSQRFGEVAGLALQELSLQREARLLLARFTAEIEPGQRIALCGPSGVGKSTLLRTIVGLEAPHAGRVLWNPAWSSERVVMVPQRAGVFQRSVRDNLCLGRNYSEAELWDALQCCGLEDFVGHLPQGLETHLGARELRLSGGEMQRLALARAVLRKPLLLILDEACSELDAEMEARVLARIRERHPQMAWLIVAHHGSSLRFVECLWHLSSTDWKVEHVQASGV